MHKLFSSLLCEDGTTNSHAQKIKKFMEQEEVAATNSLTTLHAFIN
jgi:hypothetical protein